MYKKYCRVRTRKENKNIFKAVITSKSFEQICFVTSHYLELSLLNAINREIHIQGTEIIIDPALMKVSHGTLPLSADAAVTFSAPNGLKFTWNPNDPDHHFGNDQVMMLAYDVDGGEVFESTYGNLRNTGEDVLNVSLLPGSVLEVSHLLLPTGAVSLTVYTSDRSVFNVPGNN